MKQNTEQAKKLAALLKRLEKKYKLEEPPQREPVLQMVVAFLQWEATRELAEETLGKLLGELVDLNELRISFDHELVELIGEDYPRADERVARMREALNEVYIREHRVEMQSVAGKGKREQRAYLESLPGMVPYVVSNVMLLAYGGHALPVDAKLAKRLADEGVVEPDSLPGQAEGQLLKMVKADDARDTWLLLQAWADDTAELEKGKSEPAPAKAEKSSGTKKAKTSRKKTTKKSTRGSSKSSASKSPGKAKKKSSSKRSGKSGK
ncbi:MAG: hypothetical protein ACLFV3_10780 [Phycisphaeraceae bacterium]